MCCAAFAWQELLSLEVGELRNELEGLEGELGAARHSGASLSSKVRAAGTAPLPRTVPFCACILVCLPLLPALPCWAPVVLYTSTLSCAV